MRHFTFLLAIMACATTLYAPPLSGATGTMVKPRSESPAETAYRLYRRGRKAEDKGIALSTSATGASSQETIEKLEAKANRQFRKAEKRYSKALRIRPSLTEARTALAGVQIRLGLFEQALELLDEALSINPGDSLARAYRSEALQGLQSTD